MEFNLKKVLKAMLASTSEPLSIKDIQAVITRYHEQREKQPAGTQDDENADEAGTPEQALIQDIINQVPTLLTATQIR
ncbi:MAG: hypothetical protein IJF68_00725, partial [Opitutales bacterium]|nr:hypothetical protein [Opitutales bacterium]